MDKIGYFKLLPRDLINELYHYFEKYFKDNSIIFVDADESLGNQPATKNYTPEFYYIEIYIKFPNTQYDNIKMPFKIQDRTLLLFLQQVIKNHTFVFTEKNLLKVNPIALGNQFKITSNDLTTAAFGILTNKKTDFQVFFQYNLYRFTLALRLTTEIGTTITIHNLTLLQTEVLMYKLVQLHNDIVTENLKLEY